MFDARQSNTFTGDDRVTFDWLYEVTRDGSTSTLIHGMALREAEESPADSYMKIMARVRDFMKAHLRIVHAPSPKDKVEGFLEVGVEGNEIVINHPDLKPDENGVGHIVFSPNQARGLATLLLKHADAAEKNRS
jgi:hypothetical protein